MKIENFPKVVEYWKSIIDGKVPYGLDRGVPYIYEGLFNENIECPMKDSKGDTNGYYEDHKNQVFLPQFLRLERK